MQTSSMRNSSRMRSALRAACSAGAIALAIQSAAVTSAQAQVVWGGAESSDWNAGGNWIGGVVPVETNNVQFSIAATPTNLGGIEIGSLAIEGGANVDLGNAGMDVRRNLAVTNGELILSGESSVEVGGDTTVGANGTLTIETDAELTAATLDNNGDTTIDGDFSGNVINRTSAELTNNGSIQGDIVNGRSSDFTNAGAVLGKLTNSSENAVDNSGTLSEVENLAGGSIDNSGEIIGKTTNRNRATLTNLAGGRIEDEVQNFGDLENRGGTITGAIDNKSAGLLTNSGSISGNIVNNGTVDNELGGIISGDMVNSSIVTNDAGGTLGNVANSGELTNNGLVAGNVLNSGGADFFETTGRVTGLLTNSSIANVRGVIGSVGNTSSGVMNLTGDLANRTILNGRLSAFTNSGTVNLGGVSREISGYNVTNTGTINMADKAADDVLTINGNLDLAKGAFKMDLNADSGASDQIVINGNVEGVGFIHFDSPAESGLFTKPIKVVTVEGTTSPETQFIALNADGTGPLVGVPGLIDYNLVRVGNDFQLESGISDDAPSIVGGITLINAMVGTVINRPSSPFVAGGPVEEGTSPCGLGPWSRATGGFATISGETTGSSGTSAEAEVDAFFGGYQAAADIQCFNVGKTDWTVAVGGFGGFNIGAASIALTTDLDVDFNQYYGGGYVAVSKGAFSADIQARYDFLNYSFNNEVLKFDDTEIDGDRLSVSATASYAMQAGEFAVVPTAGISYSSIDIDQLRSPIGFTLDFDTQKTFVGYAGVTVARSYPNADQTALWQPFATATVYTDFGAETESTMKADDFNIDERLTSQGIGTFGEASVGLNYVRLLPEGSQFGKQMNATIRADAKFSDRVLAAGATVQLRLQF